MSVNKDLEDYLNLQNPIDVFDNVENVHYMDYRPPDANLNNGGELVIDLLDTDGYALLEKSYFIFDLDFTKADDTRYAAGDVATLANNGLMYFYNHAVLRLNHEIIEQYSNCGLVTTVMNLLKNCRGFSETDGLSQCWSIDTTTTAVVTNSGLKNRKDMTTNFNTTLGKCQFMIPFSLMFGFQGKIITNTKCSISLNRVNNNEPFFKAAAADASKVVIESLVWRVPFVRLHLELRSEITDLIQKSIDVPFGFLTKKIEYKSLTTAQSQTWNVKTFDSREKLQAVILFFLTGSRDNQDANPSIFNHCRLTNSVLKLNSDRYPNVDLKLDFQNGKYQFLYERYRDFCKKYFDVKMSEISPDQFKNIYPMVIFDVSSQTKRTDPSVNLSIEMQFAAAVPADTTAYCLLLSEKIMTMNFNKKTITSVY